ncbi:hypothetical protein KFK09_006541 [Dendrobium nobile]|uniref:Uncharacterized protein n=1 Tax=Dendrobium nobile TaxID=94219 RepID=A0A8T3BTY7_DENNO|nr:hypothetical protein KFK09_006541 [Dendrobium nobile]
MHGSVLQKARARRLSWWWVRRVVGELGFFGWILAKASSEGWRQSARVVEKEVDKKSRGLGFVHLR